MKLKNKNIWADILFGVAVGDALGVPVEFKSRDYLDENSVTEMTGYGTHFQPPGTWSDDSSLTFCLAEAIFEGYSLERTAKKFISWKNEGYWAAHGEVFDIGTATSSSISRLEQIINSGEIKKLSELKNNSEEWENGNGSLMRVLPLLIVIKDLDIRTQFEIVRENSALTHRHIRAAMACMIYLKVAELIVDGSNQFSAYYEMKSQIVGLWDDIEFPGIERNHFSRIIDENIIDLSRGRIRSDGYVIHSLEASFWSFLTTNNYESAVLTAVNLGGDTDTTGAITGGLAGLYYGATNIKKSWIEMISRKEEIIGLVNILLAKYSM